MARQLRTSQETATRLTDARGRQVPRRKDAGLERSLYRRRLLAALVLILLAVAVLIGRMAKLQVLDHEHFTTLSEHNRVRLQPLTPTRGLIFDRNGVLLAENLPSHRLELVREQIEDLDATLEQLRTLVAIDDNDINRFKRLSRGRAPYSGVPLRFNLSTAEVARLAVELHRLPGVDISADLHRHYPLGRHAVHVVGYVGRIDEQELKIIDVGQYAGSSHIGKTGIERSHETALHGRVGHQQVETNAQGRVLRVLQKTSPVPGQNLYLTIDIRFQRAVEQALGDYTGAIVALEPSTGEVLALASQPGYDPNPFVNGIDHASYRALNSSPERPLFNRAVLGMYPPGSTIKPMMALIGLDSGVHTRNSSIYCPGFFAIPGQERRFRDWRRSGHGSVNLTRAVAESCDVYFYQLALDLGIERMNEQLARFGLGAPTGIDLVGERGGLIPSIEWKRRVHQQPWYAGETVIAGIGQGYMLTTPLQLAHATATVAMQGQRYQPRLLQARQDQASLQVEAEPPKPLTSMEIEQPLHWRYVIQSMDEVVHGRRGTARRIGETAPYRIAGKTGTAQVFSLAPDQEYDARTLDRRLHDHALFIAFAPLEDPQIALAVIVEHGGGGSSVAAPIARQVLDAYLLNR